MCTKTIQVEKIGDVVSLRLFDARLVNFYMEDVVLRNLNNTSEHLVLVNNFNIF